jgi:hypothetical protein
MTLHGSPDNVKRSYITGPQDEALGRFGPGNPWPEPDEPFHEVIEQDAPMDNLQRELTEIESLVLLMALSAIVEPPEVELLSSTV